MPIDGLVELMLCFVQQGTQFVYTYGDIQENFYGSMESAYAEVCKLVAINDLGDKWGRHCYCLKPTGYGYGGNIRDIFYDIFS